MGLLTELIRQKKEGQSVMEYTVLLAIIATAFVSMGLYLQRAVQGRLNLIAGQIAPQVNKTPAYFRPWTPPI